MRPDNASSIMFDRDDYDALFETLKAGGAGGTYNESRRAPLLARDDTEEGRRRLFLGLDMRDCLAHSGNIYTTDDQYERPYGGGANGASSDEWPMDSQAAAYLRTHRECNATCLPGYSALAKLRLTCDPPRWWLRPEVAEKPFTAADNEKYVFDDTGTP